MVTQCNTLQHTAIHCNTLQHTATHCNTLQRTATHCNALQRTATHCNTLPHTATRCNTLQHCEYTRRLSKPLHTSLQRAHFSRGLQAVVEVVALLDCGPAQDVSHMSRHELIRGGSLQQRTATHCNTLQLTATHCNALQRIATATHCNRLTT